jgi:hypothetical protein
MRGAGEHLTSHGIDISGEKRFRSHVGTPTPRKMVVTTLISVTIADPLWRKCCVPLKFSANRACLVGSRLEIKGEVSLHHDLEKRQLWTKRSASLTRTAATRSWPYESELINSKVPRLLSIMLI